MKEFSRVIYYFIEIIDLLIFLIFVLVNVAFITLLERKVLGYSQRRLGPNKPSYAGLLQPMADAVKLFVKTFLNPDKRHKIIFYLSPGVGLFLVLWIWLAIPRKFENEFFTFSIILILIVLRLNVYPLLLRGWGSRNKYSIIGALRRVAQTISYEIRLALIILIILIYLKLISFDVLKKINIYYRCLMVLPIIFILWLISSLAETNRTPFDFSEGERELVSGFNTEFGAGGFALIFMAEYGRIYFLRIVTGLIFFWNRRFFWLRVWVTWIVFIWVWARTTFPRYRYDLLINLAWKNILPVVLRISIFSISFILY